MSSFASHIDSIVSLVLGVIFTWWGHRPSKSFGPRARKIFRVCGPATVAISALLLLKPRPTPTWSRQFTPDRRASAEFPGVATPEETTDTMGALRVTNRSLTHRVPDKDLFLILTCSALPDHARAMTDDQRIDATAAFMEQQGARILSRQTDPGGTIHRMEWRQDASKSTTQIALAYVADYACRVVATWTDGSEDRALTDRFVQSFRMEAPPPS